MATVQCSEGECEKKVVARGMCPMHYARWSKPYKDAGLPLPPKPRRESKRAMCCIEDCGKPVVGGGLCSKHYTRNLRNGDPMVVQYIRGDDAMRFESYVDRSAGPDACHLWTGGQCTGGYAQIRIDGDLRLVHVVAWESEHGPKPPGIDIDHECHNRAVRAGTCQPGICRHRLCCNLRHLVAKTRREHRDGTVQWDMPAGDRPRLTEAQKEAIRDLLATGKTARWIAQQYDIHVATVTRVKKGL